MLLFGAMNTLVLKAMDDAVLRKDDQGNDVTFNHPYFQGSIMFLGELTCLFVYMIKVTFCARSADQE